MSFEPKNFFVGLVDFFSILMPGAVATFLGKEWVLNQSLPFEPPTDSAEAVALLLFVSYVLGHFIFLLGAVVLDEFVYDPMRKWTYWGQVQRLAQGHGFSANWAQRIAASKLLFGRFPDEAVLCVSRHKARLLYRANATQALNAYQWSKARLSKENPEGLAAVQRFEADSKFFRSFVVVLVVLTLVWLVTLHWAWALVSFGFSLLAFVRYIEQRFKATQQAYWNIIALDAAESNAFAPTYPERSDGLTHAGGVVRRRKNASFEYLLVTAKKNRDEWLLPKGHIEPGEEPEQTAVREVLEETGCWARIVGHIDDALITNTEATARVRFFLMHLVAEERLNQGDAHHPSTRIEERGIKWLSLEEAESQATFAEVKAVFTKHKAREARVKTS